MYNFMWILEELDRPFIPSEWLITIETNLRRNNPLENVLGQYIGKMKLCAFRDLRFNPEDRRYSENAQCAPKRAKQTTLLL